MNSPRPARRSSISYSPFATTPRRETCPLWPGQPMTAHWGIPDPAAATGTPAEIALAFKDAYRMLHQRIGIFAALPLRSLDQLTLQNKLKEIGRMHGAAAKAAEPT